MKQTFLGIALASLFFFSLSAHAIVSYCAPGPDYDSFFHRASLDVMEMSFPYVRTSIETHVSGPISPSLYSTFHNTWNSWHFFVDMPPGNYYWQGYSQSEVEDGDFLTEIFGISLCSGYMQVTEPPFCDSSAVQVTGSSTLTSNIHGYLVSAIKGGFEAVEKLGVCSSTGSPGFSGSLKLENVSQCCENSDTYETATRATGRATFSVPGLSCSLKQIIVPAYGIVLQGSVGAGASAALSYSGMDQGMCGSTSSEITLSGSVSGGFGGEIGVGGISTRIIGAGVRLSDSFSLSASGPDVQNLDIQGCIGPAEITGWVRFLGSEVRTNIVPREWAQGTSLCF